jgi:hypothetical protein
VQLLEIAIKKRAENKNKTRKKTTTKEKNFKKTKKILKNFFWRRQFFLFLFSYLKIKNN